LYCKPIEIKAKLYILSRRKIHRLAMCKPLHLSRESFPYNPWTL
jgi:hypothetical protein